MKRIAAFLGAVFSALSCFGQAGITVNTGSGVITAPPAVTGTNFGSANKIPQASASTSTGVVPVWNGMSWIPTSTNGFGGGGSATNAVATIKTNSVTVATGVTTLNFSNVAASVSGSTVNISPSASGGGGNNFDTNWFKTNGAVQVTFNPQGTITGTKFLADNGFWQSIPQGTNGRGPFIIPGQYYLGNNPNSNDYVKIVPSAKTLASNYTSQSFIAGPLSGYGHIQGVDKDASGSVYLSFTAALFKIANDAAFTNGTTVTLLASNTTAQGTVLPATAHYGGLKVFNGKLYVASESFTNENSYADQSIAIFNTSDMTFTNNVQATNEGYEISGLAIVPTSQSNGVIFVSSYHTNNPVGVATNGNNLLRMYDLSTFAFLGDFIFTDPIQWMQDVAWSPYYNRFYVAGNPPIGGLVYQQLFTVDLQGRIGVVSGSTTILSMGQGDTIFEGLTSPLSNEVVISYFNGAAGERVTSLKVADTVSAHQDFLGNWYGNKTYSTNGYYFSNGDSFTALGNGILEDMGTGSTHFWNSGGNTVHEFLSDGSGFLDRLAGVAQIRWDTSGNLTLTGSLTSAGVTSTGVANLKNLTTYASPVASLYMDSSSNVMAGPLASGGLPTFNGLQFFSISGGNTNFQTNQTFDSINITGKITNQNLTASVLTGTDANKALTSVSVGTGLSLIGGTLAATGSGGSSTFSTQFVPDVTGTNLATTLSIRNLSVSNNVNATNVGMAANITVGTNNEGIGSQGFTDLSFYGSNALPFGGVTNEQIWFQPRGTQPFTISSQTNIASTGYVFAVSNAQNNAILFGVLSNANVNIGGVAVGTLALRSGGVNNNFAKWVGAVSLGDGGFLANNVANNNGGFYTNAIIYGKTTNYSGFDSTNNIFSVNTLWTNIPTAGVFYGRKGRGAVTFSITPSVTVTAQFGVIVTLNNGRSYTNKDSVDPITGVTGTFLRTITIDSVDSNSIVNVTNMSSAGPTVSVDSDHMVFE